MYDTLIVGTVKRILRSPGKAFMLGVAGIFAYKYMKDAQVIDPEKDNK